MNLVSRAPSFLLLGLVLVAAALLIAGYGAPVGFGVIVGLLLGLAVILAFLAMRPRSIGRSSWSFLSASQSSTRPEHELLQRYHFDSMRVAGVDAGALRRVIPVASTVEARGVRIELVAVELREDGGIATLAAHTRPPIGILGHFVEVAVSDETGTAYAASGQGSGGSNVGTARYEIRLAPAPPASTRMLTLRVVSFAGPFGDVAVRVDGPWEFRVDL